MPEKKVYVARKGSRGQHAWVFSNEVLGTSGDPGAGDSVLVFDRGRFVGSGVYNPNSLIRVRVYSNVNEELDLEFVKRALKSAWEYRVAQLPDETDFRLVYGESDSLPGLVVDKFGRNYVIQSYSVAMEQRLELVSHALVQCFDVESVFEKNDFRLRDAEGLERRERALYGSPGKRILISENGARFEVDIANGQKTGYYYDQRTTRRRVREMARGRDFLDVFCYTGGFAINAALGGARRVVGVDGSVAAANIAVANARLNGVSSQCEFVVAEAFRFLKQLCRMRGAERNRESGFGTAGEEQELRDFDMICLDPPAFIKSRREKEGGMQGFRTINALAMKALPRGGILVSCSCSHYLFWQDMLDMLVAAAQEAGRSFTIIDRTTQGPDHPVLLSMPESEYLRCFFLRVA